MKLEFCGKTLGSSLAELRGLGRHVDRMRGGAAAVARNVAMLLVLGILLRRGRSRERKIQLIGKRGLHRTLLGLGCFEARGI